jgi:hypothetical protein
VEYHKAKDIATSSLFFGTRECKNTDIYINLEQAIFDEGNDKFHSATAETVEEAQSLIEVGFEFVCTYNDMMLFRKRK